MGIIAWIVLGLGAGLLANMLIPGRRSQGLVLTCLIGVAGALLGGWLATKLFHVHTLHGFFNLSTWLTAIAGAAMPSVTSAIAPHSKLFFIFAPALRVPTKRFLNLRPTAQTPTAPISDQTITHRRHHGRLPNATLEGEVSCVEADKLSGLLGATSKG